MRRSFTIAFACVALCTGSSFAQQPVVAPGNPLPPMGGAPPVGGAPGGATGGVPPVGGAPAPGIVPGSAPAGVPPVESVPTEDPNLGGGVAPTGGGSSMGPGPIDGTLPGGPGGALTPGGPMESPQLLAPNLTGSGSSMGVGGTTGGVSKNNTNITGAAPSAHTSSVLANSLSIAAVAASCAYVLF